MEREPNNQLPASAERVRLKKPIGRPVFRLFAFVVCTAILVAAFAVSQIWSGRGEATETPFGGLFHRKRVTELPGQSEPAPETDGSPSETDVNDAPSTRPDGAVSVFTQTLSEAPRQTTGTEEIMWKVSLPDDGPSVLILCTDPMEAYLDAPTEWLDGDIGNLIRSDDPSRCVTAAAEALRESLFENGINAVCAETESSASVRGSYARAACVISAYLDRYPTIRYVIDVGRDPVIDSEGNCIRTIAKDCETPIAQVMAVVGTDYGGASCPSWRENLALAEALGAELNREIPSIFRGTTLRTSPVNQQLAPRSLTLGIGSCVNTTEEAVRAAKAIGKALAAILHE